MKLKKTAILLFVTILVTPIVLLISGCSGDCLKKDDHICKIKIGKHRANLRIAYSDYAQQRGLMWVGHLENNSGMIFVYNTPRYLSFWMKNTIIPLSIAFVEESGQISSIQDMYPQPGKKDHELPLYQSTTLVKYAIEMELGWFSEKGIRGGDYVTIPKALK